MFGWMAKRLFPYLSEILVESVKRLVIDLDKEKFYILVLPENTNTDDISKALKPYANDVNLLIITADRWSMLELTPGKSK